MVGCVPLSTAAKSVSVTSPRNPSASAPAPPASRQLTASGVVLELLVGHGLAQVANRLLDAGEFADRDHRAESVFRAGEGEMPTSAYSFAVPHKSPPQV